MFWKASPITGYHSIERHSALAIGMCGHGMGVVLCVRASMKAER